MMVGLIVPRIVLAIGLLLVLDASFTCKPNTVVDSYNCDKDDPYSGFCAFNTEYTIKCHETCQNEMKNLIWGTTNYTYDSSVCRSALHDLRISTWNTSQRTVKFIRINYDPEQYHNTIRQRIESRRYGIITKGSGLFYFTSPRIKEPLLDVTSLHRNFLYVMNQNSVQDCHLPSHSQTGQVAFEYHVILDGIGKFKGDIKQGASSQYFRMIWGKGLQGKIRDALPGGVICRPSLNDLSYVTSMTMRQDAHFLPRQLTKTVNVGEKVTLSMRLQYDIPKTHYYGVTWRKDAKELDIFKDFTTSKNGGEHQLQYESVLQGHAGIYSLELAQYYLTTNGERYDRRAVVRLIVRNCPDKMYGDNCEQHCPDCQHGGVCHDILGVCICPPGFNGTDCEIPCGPNSYGRDCSMQCSDSDASGSETCSGILFCLPDPYGCSCATGFKNIDCRTTCSPGEFGAGCTQKRNCSCLDGEPCDVFTGTCLNGCAEGWKGTICDTPYPVLKFPPKLLLAKPTSLDISFQAWNGNTGEGTPAYYIVELKKYVASGNFEAKEQINAATLTFPAERNISIQGLTPNTFYAVRVVIEDKDGGVQRERAPTILFRTLCGRPQKPPFDLKAATKGPRLVTLSWKIPSPETWMCSNITIRVSYNSSLNSTEKVVENDTFTFDSKPFTVWNMAVRIETEKGQFSEWAKFKQLTTDEAAPGVPKYVQAYFQPLTKSIFVNWTKPDEPNGIIRNYSVELVHINWQHSCKYNIQPIAFSVLSSVTNAIFNDVQFASSYAVKVSAVTVAEGPTMTKVVNTPESIPQSAPLNLRIYTIGEDSCQIQWDKPECQLTNGAISHFEMTFLGLEEWAANATINRTTVINSVTGLLPFTNYSLRVFCCTSMGCSQLYAEKTFKTLSSNAPPPRNLTVFSTTTNSLSLTWNAPYPPYGRIIEYRIYFKKTPGIQKTYYENLSLSETTCKGSELRANQSCYTITKLESLSYYQIWVTAINHKSQEGQVSQMVFAETSESIPDPPKKVQLEHRTENELFISWLEPIRSNGELKSYRVKVTLVNLYGLYPKDGDLKLSLEVEAFVTTYNVTDLEPASTYNISVEAATSKGFGPPTDIAVATRPSVPVVKTRPQVGRITKNSVQLLIKPLIGYHGPISAYYVMVKDVTNNARYKRAAFDDLRSYNQSHVEYVSARLDTDTVGEKGFNITVGDGKYYGGYYNAPLINGRKYLMGTGVLSEVMGESEFGYTYLDEAVLVTEKKSPVVISNSTIIIGIILAVILICGAVFLFLYYKKPELCHTMRPKAGDTFFAMFAKPRQVRESSESNLSVNDMEDLYDDCLVRNSIKSNPIEVCNLEAYVQEACISAKISQEFLSISKGVLHQCRVAKNPDNKIKNRYGNLLPYDHSRVKLGKLEGDSNSDYINASYIENYNGDTKFIATQGPKPLTVPDFYRMAWQENTCKIIMVTNLVESGKTKCEKYWPDAKPTTYGQFKVALAETVTLADFVIRTLVVSMGDEQREIKQFHFTTWPDHDIPAYPVAVTTFLKHVRNYRTDHKAPVIVHCSAGVGRTGTVILLENMIEMGKETNMVDPLKGLWSLRQSRVHLVETLEQYKFVYNALADYLCGGETSTVCPEFRHKFDELVSEKHGVSVIQQQFERLQRICPLPKFTDCRSAHETDNGSKNRIADILPPEAARAILPTRDIMQNDYINAVYVNGYKHSAAFIATQLPLPETVNDFWRLVVTTRTTTIVLLHEFNKSDSTCPQYWEEGATQTYDDFSVQHVSTETQGSLLVRTFSVQDIHLNSEVITVKQFHLQGWMSHQDIPPTPDCILDVIEKAERWQKNTGDRTILVQCLNGASGCGIFCAAVFICDKIKMEQEVDVYLAVRNVRMNRPQFITNLNQYVFLHKVAIMYLDSFETYANFQ